MSRRTEKNVGIIGLGIIGRGIADCLRRGGFHVFVWNRTPRPFPNFVGSPAELAELCDFVQIFVSDDVAVLQMAREMKPSLKAHHIVMVHSTVAPDTMREVAEIVQRRGAQLLDSPFTGSKDAAAKGELVYYVAGDEAAYRRARPILEASSKEIIEIGEIGQAMTIKVATNMITAATVQAAAEALALVQSAGIPLEKFATAMRSNGSNSGTLGMKLPKMMSGDFEPHFSVKHMLKDVQIASRLARSHGLRLGVTEVAREALVEEAERGGADYDYSSVVRSYFSEPAPPPAPEEMTETEDRPTVEEMPDETEREEREERAEPQSNEDAMPPVDLGDEEATEVSRESRTIEPEGESEPVRAEEEAASTSDEAIEESLGKQEPAAPASANASNANGEKDKTEERRSFLSRIFGRGTDY